VVNMCSRPDISICGAVHVKLNFFICCLTLCCNVGAFLTKGIGEDASACHESMGVGENSIAALTLNLGTRGEGSGQLETSAPVHPGKELLYPVNRNLGGFRSWFGCFREGKISCCCQGSYHDFLVVQPATQLLYQPCYPNRITGCKKLKESALGWPSVGYSSYEFH